MGEQKKRSLNEKSGQLPTQTMNFNIEGVWTARANPTAQNKRWK
jgi:hypothetical protein